LLVATPLAFLAGLVGLFTDRSKGWAVAALLVSGPLVAWLLWPVIASLCR
jgi:hypothetical protein